MKVFRMQDDLESYTYPILKIVVSIIIIAITVYRDKIFTIESQLLRTFVALISSIVVILCFICIYISFAEIVEMLCKKAERKRNRKNTSASKTSYEVVVKTINSNDILEYKILFDKKAIKIGSSSDYNHSNGKFFDKRFYIADKEYTDLDDFKTDLIKMTTDGCLNVISIDDIIVSK